MEENKLNIEENKFINDDIMKALLKMTPENKVALLTFDFGILSNIANDAESAKNAVENCGKYIAGWQRAKGAIIEFVEKIQEQTTESVINDMAKVYKELSREERLELNKKLQEENTLENSLDMFGHSWNNLMRKLQKVVK